MSSRVIPKEHLTAYQRWELAGIEDAGHGAGSGQGETAVSASLPTAAQLEQIHQQAWQEGYRLGEEEGRKAGFEAGKKAGEAHARRLGELVESLDVQRFRHDEEIAREVLGLALAVSRQMLRAALLVKEGLVLEVIRDALGSLPSLSGHLRIVVHPEDVDQVRDFMTQEHGHFAVKVVEDSRMERGGFRLETSHSEVDGQVGSRWREIVDCLGADSQWLE